MVELEMTCRILSPLGAAVLSVAAGMLLPSCRMSGGDLPVEEMEIRRAQAPDDTELFPTPHALNVPADSAALNDSARFLAGMGPLGGQDGFASLRGTSQWKNGWSLGGHSTIRLQGSVIPCPSRLETGIR
jgi:hypothetical protein